MPSLSYIMFIVLIVFIVWLTASVEWDKHSRGNAHQSDKERLIVSWHPSVVLAWFQQALWASCGLLSTPWPHRAHAHPRWLTGHLDPPQTAAQAIPSAALPCSCPASACLTAIPLASALYCEPFLTYQSPVSNSQ